MPSRSRRRVLHIVTVTPLEPFRLEIEFDDSERTRKVVDLEPLIEKGGVYRHLRNIELFRSVTVENGVVYWDFDHGPTYARGIDVAPECLFDLEDMGETLV